MSRSVLPGLSGAVSRPRPARRTWFLRPLPLNPVTSAPARHPIPGVSAAGPVTSVRRLRGFCRRAVLTVLEKGPPTCSGICVPEPSGVMINVRARLRWEMACSRVYFCQCQDTTRRGYILLRYWHLYECDAIFDVDLIFNSCLSNKVRDSGNFAILSLCSN